MDYDYPFDIFKLFLLDIGIFEIYSSLIIFFKYQAACAVKQPVSNRVLSFKVNNNIHLPCSVHLHGLDC